MRTLLLAIALLALALAVPPATGSHCTSSSTSPSDALIGAGGKTYYYVSQGPYLYEETGVKVGLQRSDPQKDDTCHGTFASHADTRLL